MKTRLAHIFILVTVWFTTVSAATATSSRASVEEFLKITGFDVALESIKLSATSAPAMLGLQADAFGARWQMLSEKVFDTVEMHQIAAELLQNTLSEDLLEHANAFYGSEFGARIVAAENTSHMTSQEDGKGEAGEAIVAGLQRIGSNRLEELKRMNAAVGSAEASVKAMQEIQLRFLMAAAAAGVIELRTDEDGMRAMLERQAPGMLFSIQQSSLSGSAYTYQAFSDSEITAYADALEHPMMQKVYQLMNAVQYEVMANRFEALAKAMQHLRPSTDL